MWPYVFSGRKAPKTMNMKMAREGEETNKRKKKKPAGKICHKNISMIRRSQSLTSAAGGSQVLA